MPDRPEGADAWIDGEWVRQHGRWYWLLGRWVKAPKGATYSPWVVVRARDGTLYYAPSVWRDATGNPIPPPPALSYATASGGAIVGPEGDLEPTGRSIKIRPARVVHPDEGKTDGAP